MRSFSTSALVVATALTLVGCPRVEPPPPPPDDAGPIETDAPPAVRVDTDEDGLCDDTEIAWGTDPTSIDSDADGFTDRVERDFGYAPLIASSPARELLVFMNETPDDAVQIGVERAIRGRGETFSGAFSALPVVDRLDLTAADLYERSVAVGAMPPENVFEVREDEEQFVGVFGTTLMTFEVRFAFGDNLPRSCARAYPFRYDIKRDDGATVFIGRYLLVVLPEGDRLDTTVWCVPEGGCL